MSQLKPISAFLTDNTMRTYYALEADMFKAHEEDRDEEAEKTARILLENADLPLIIRAKACMILGCLDVPDFLDMAKEAVRIIDVGIAQTPDEEPGKHVTEMRADAARLLREAQEAFDEEGEGAEAGEEQTGYDGDQQGKLDHLPVISTADQLKIKESIGSASGPLSSFGLAAPATSKAVSRMHSSNTDKGTNAPLRRSSRLKENAVPPTPEKDDEVVNKRDMDKEDEDKMELDE